jgi:hypothetical protein
MEWNGGFGLTGMAKVDFGLSCPNSNNTKNNKKKKKIVSTKYFFRKGGERKEIKTNMRATLDFVAPGNNGESSTTLLPRIS